MNFSFETFLSSPQKKQTETKTNSSFLAIIVDTNRYEKSCFANQMVNQLGGRIIDDIDDYNCIKNLFYGYKRDEKLIVVLKHAQYISAKAQREADYIVLEKGKGLLDWMQPYEWQIDTTLTSNYLISFPFRNTPGLICYKRNLPGSKKFNPESPERIKLMTSLKFSKRKIHLEKETNFKSHKSLLQRIKNLNERIYLLQKINNDG
jgi:hypothetical protein